MPSEVAIHKNSLKPHALGMIILLAVQYLLGEFTSLFVSFPKDSPSNLLWKFAWQQIPLALHIIIGALLVIGTIALFIRAIFLKERIWLLASIVGVISTIGAFISGAVFIPTQKDMFSFTMAVYFIFALFAYFWGLYASK